MHTLVDYIPYFLNNCRKKGYSQNTQKNYDRYLNGFRKWLKECGKENLRPDQLSQKDIENYRQYLINRKIKDVTQNYYLIALRALLKDLSEKDITSLPPDRIKLPRFDRIGFKNTLEPAQLEKLISSININTKMGLRDRAIIEILINSSLKTNQLACLNLDQIQINLPDNCLYWITKYLQTRNSNKKSLFCVSGRTIERIVNRYGRIIGLPYALTPEILRWSYLSIILEKDKNPKLFQGIYIHRKFLIKDYKYDCEERMHNKPVNMEKQWDIVEGFVSKELDWLKRDISIMPSKFEKKPSPLLECDDCIFRKIAILITTGKIIVNKLEYENNYFFWDASDSEYKNFYHGKDWHRKTMSILCDFFKKRGYEVKIEPITNYGRADLGINLNNKSLYIEIGTISLFKLWYNLVTMGNAVFLLIPNEKYILEFII